MPSVLLGKPKDELHFVSVTPKLMYGFRSRELSSIAGISADDLTALGHTIDPTTFVAGQVYIFGANAPKPARMSKKTTGGVGVPQSVSTFCAYNTIPTAMAKKWRMIKRPRGISTRGAAGPGKEQTGVVEINGGLYCFSCDRATLSTYGTDLGIADATAINSQTERDRAFRGASWPRPGTASLLVDAGAGILGTVSSFCAPDKSPAGWSIQPPILGPLVPTP
jgi:hypothetical protein